MSDHNTAKAKWMREVGAVDASWDATGNLLRLQLGPLTPADDDRTQPKTTSPQEQERQQREQRRALASRASGGPVRRLSEDAG